MQKSYDYGHLLGVSITSYWQLHHKVFGLTNQLTYFYRVGRDAYARARDALHLKMYFQKPCRCFCLSRGSTGILGLGRMFRRYYSVDICAMAYFSWLLSSCICWMSSRIDDDGSKSICYEEFRKGIHDTGLDMEEQGYKVLAALWNDTEYKTTSSLLGAVLAFW